MDQWAASTGMRADPSLQRMPGAAKRAWRAGGLARQATACRDLDVGNAVPGWVQRKMVYYGDLGFVPLDATEPVNPCRRGPWQRRPLIPGPLDWRQELQ